MSQCSINIAKDQLEANKILPTLIRELGRKSERYQHGDYMKSKIFFIVMVVVVATMPLGLATVGRLHASRETAPPVVRLADSTGAGTTRGSYCFIGARSEQGQLDRGWVCLPKNVP
jgi:hypothetical protein